MLTAYDITGEAYHHTREDVDTLHKLADMLPPQPVVVNIGTCFGTSALAVAEQRADAYVFTIDINPCPIAVRNWEAAGTIAERIVQILGRSQQVGRAWPWRIHMVFVDGAHDMASVEDDIRVWGRNVATDGIMAFHDYGTPSLPHVKATVDHHMDPVRVIAAAGTIRAYRL